MDHIMHLWILHVQYDWHCPLYLGFTKNWTQCNGHLIIDSRILHLILVHPTICLYFNVLYVTIFISLSLYVTVYCMSRKSCPVTVVYPICTNGQNFLDTLCIGKYSFSMCYIYYVSKNLWPILYSNLPYEMGHYFLDRQYLYDIFFLHFVSTISYSFQFFYSTVFY